MRWWQETFEWTSTENKRSEAVAKTVVLSPTEHARKASWMRAYWLTEQKQTEQRGLPALT